MRAAGRIATSMKGLSVTGIAYMEASPAGSNRETRSCTYIATYGAVQVERPKVAISWPTLRSAFIYLSFARCCFFEWCGNVRGDEEQSSSQIRTRAEFLTKDEEKSL